MINKKGIQLEADHMHVNPIIVDDNEEIYFWNVFQVIIQRYPVFSTSIEERIHLLNEKLNKLSNNKN